MSDFTMFCMGMTIGVVIIFIDKMIGPYRGRRKKKNEEVEFTIDDHENTFAGYARDWHE